MKFFLILFLVISSFFTLSCNSTSDREKDEAETTKCLKQRSKDLKYKSIDDALASYDFETARKYLSCYKDNCYVDAFKTEREGTRCKCDRNESTPYNKEKIKILQSEITYFASVGEYQKAEYSAKEADRMDLYEKISGETFEKKLDEMIDQNEYKKIYTFLSNMRLQYKKSKYNFDSEPNEPNISGNDEFNESARYFNTYLDKVLGKYKYNKVEKAEISSLIDLSLPELIERKYLERGHTFTGSSLTDVYKKEATLKYLK